MFAKKSQIKDMITKKVNDAVEEERVKNIKALMDLEERLRGEFEIILQSKESDIEILELRCKDLEDQNKEAIDVYYFSWDLISRVASSANKAELYYDRLEKAMGGILQSVRTLGKEAIQNKQLLFEKDTEHRKKLRLNNGDLKKQLS